MAGVSGLGGAGAAGADDDVVVLGEEAFDDGALQAGEGEGGDGGEVLKDVVEKAGCAYVPGSSFYADGKTFNALRLNYSNATPAEIEKGIKALGGYFTKLLED